MRCTGEWTRRAAAPLALAWLLFATSSSAIVANPPPRACSAYSDADAIVAAHIGAQRTDWEWASWDVEVERVYKGDVPKRFRVYTRNDSARGTPDPERRNLLFLRRDGARLVIGGSDPNGGNVATPWIEARIWALSKRTPQGPGSIRLLVASEPSAPFARARVRLHRDGDARDRIVRTDAQGRLTLLAAPSRWTAKIVEPGWTSRVSVYGYDDPDGFTLSPGGCADLRLEPLRLRSGG